MRCITYSGYIGKGGYGYDYDPDTGKTCLAHRLAFKNAFGYLPEVVMHTCDDPSCVNPEHLKGGTQSENIKDCVAKGRYKSQQKLELDDCKAIVLSPLSSRKLGKIYNVNQKTILNIKNSKYAYKELRSCGV
jgi:hypothetical protein